MKIAPQGPTAAASTPPTEGWLSCWISARGMTPKDRIDTDANSASTPRKPITVAMPTSSRFLAKRE